MPSLDPASYIAYLKSWHHYTGHATHATAALGNKKKTVLSQEAVACKFFLRFLVPDKSTRTARVSMLA